MKPNKEKALFLARREVSQLVADAVQLEGINFTVPEVQTLLNGISVGGKSLADQAIVLNQAAAWKSLFSSIENNKFSLNKEFCCELHGVAAKGESLEWGCFRSGAVTIAGTDYMPPEASELNDRFSGLLSEIMQHKNPYDAAIRVFLGFAKNQFFYDVNKRMGRFMMNGLLLSKGLPVINVPAGRQLEFNEGMLNYYRSKTNDATEMTAFLMSCIHAAYRKEFELELPLQGKAKTGCHPD